MTKNLLVGLSTQNRSGKYLYYGGYDTDDIQSLVAGEIGIFWASKSAGPDADTGAFTGGGSNDDLTSGAGSNVDIADTPNVVTGIDKFFFSMGTSTKPRNGLVIDPKNMSFKVLEYVAPVKKVQTVTIAAASLVAGKVIGFSAYSKDAPIGATGGLKEMDVEYTIPTGGTATTIGAALKALIDAHAFGIKYFYSTSEAHSSDVVLTITWKAGYDGTILNNSWATATSTVATTTAFKVGNGTGASIVALEKECNVLGGYNPADDLPGVWTETANAASTSTYHLVTITSKDNTSDSLGLNPPVGVLKTQYIAIDTSDSGMVLLEEMVGLLTDMVEKRAVSGAA